MAGSRLGLAMGAFVGATALLSPAEAQASPTARLVYVRGAGADNCPDEESLKQSVAARLGYDPFRPFVNNVLFAEIKSERGRFIGNLRVIDEVGIERGSRTIESRSVDCTEIAASMALSISIAIDPRSAFHPVAAPPAETTATEPPPPAPPQSEPPAITPAPATEPAHAPSDDADQRASDAHVEIGLGLGLHGSAGMGVAPTAGAHGSLEARFPSWSTGLELRADLPVTRDTAKGTVGTSLIGAALVPCARVRWASACAVVLLARARAETSGVATPRSDAFPWLGAGMRLAGDVPLVSNLALRVALDFLGALTPFSIELNGQRVYASPTVSGSAAATMVYFF